MITKALQWCLGALFVPVAMGYSFAFYEQLIGIQEIRAANLSFLLGVTAYLAFHAWVSVPARAYVFGHEITHAAATWLSGGQVKGFKAGAKKGSVTTDRVTALIALAPYLVPVYSILWAFLYGVAGLFWSVGPWLPWFCFGLGATLAFHLTFTVNVLKEKQPDLEVAGPLLSLGLILWANVTLVVGVMSLLIPQVRFGYYLTDGCHHTRALYQAVFIQLFIR